LLKVQFAAARPTGAFALALPTSGLELRPVQPERHAAPLGHDAGVPIPAIVLREHGQGTALPRVHNESAAEEQASGDRTAVVVLVAETAIVPKQAECDNLLVHHRAVIMRRLEDLITAEVARRSGVPAEDLATGAAVAAILAAYGSAIRRWILDGAKSLVPAGDHADAFVVPARVDGALDDPQGIALFLVTRGAVGAATRGYQTLDGARAAELRLHQVRAALLVRAGWPALEEAADAGIAAACAEGVGVMDRLVALTVDYMNTRRQFGVPIASFQALRHRIADVKMQLELARSMSYFASLKLGEPAPARRRALAQAKLQLGQSMRFVGQQCIQLHGGIGVTDEYIASHYFKRLTVMELTYGDTLHQVGEVAARMQDTAGVFA